jgi:hypothetical protein
MAQSVTVEIEMPEGWETFHLPSGLHRRLQDLLDLQDRNRPLTPTEREEAQGLVDMAEWLSLLRLNARRVGGRTSQPL